LSNFASIVLKMKKLLFIVGLALTIEGSAQITKAFDFQCACTVVTNRYDSGKKSSEYHENSDGKKDGLETVWYAEGGKQYERNWSNGKLDGTGIHYHRNGNVYYEEQYEKGNKTGVWKFHDEAGDLMQTIDYSHGTSKEVHAYYHAGVKFFEQTLSNGKMVSEAVHNQDIYDQLKSEAETNGKPQ